MVFIFLFFLIITFYWEIYDRIYWRSTRAISSSGTIFKSKFIWKQIFKKTLFFPTCSSETKMVFPSEVISLNPPKEQAKNVCWKSGMFLKVFFWAGDKFHITPPPRFGPKTGRGSTFLDKITNFWGLVMKKIMVRI